MTRKHRSPVARVISHAKVILLLPAEAPAFVGAPAHARSKRGVAY
jgi:hypothetical protein